MMDSRKITDLDPRVQPLCRAHVAACKAVGIELLVTSTWRDIEAQNALYAIGRTTQLDRKPVTNAKGGQSWHNFKTAYDVVPLIGGKAAWNDAKLWREIVRLGKSLGLEAGADWVSFPDRPHFQLKPTGMTLVKAGQLFAAKGTIFYA